MSKLSLWLTCSTYKNARKKRKKTTIKKSICVNYTTHVQTSKLCVSDHKGSWTLHPTHQTCCIHWFYIGLMHVLWRAAFNVSYLVMFFISTFNIYEVTASSIELFINGVRHNFILIQICNRSWNTAMNVSNLILHWHCNSKPCLLSTTYHYSTSGPLGPVMGELYLYLFY